MSKNNFILYKDYKPHVDMLSDEQAGKLFKAIFEYVDGRTENDLDPLTKMAFSFIKSNLERDLIKYKNIVERNRANGKKGGRPPKEENPNNPSGLSNNPNKPKKADIGIDIGIGTDIDIDNDIDIKESLVVINNEDLDIIDIFDFWNSLDIIKHSKLNAERKKLIAKAIKEYGKDNLMKFMTRYKTVLSDPNDINNYSWKLEIFLKQKNALLEFTDEGSKWINYDKNKNNKSASNGINKPYRFVDNIGE